MEKPQIQRLETKEDLETLLPGDIVEVRHGMQGVITERVFEDINDYEISFLDRLVLDGDGKTILRTKIPREGLVVNEGHVIYLNCIPKENYIHPSSPDYKTLNQLLEKAGEIKWQKKKNIVLEK